MQVGHLSLIPHNQTVGADQPSIDNDITSLLQPKLYGQAPKQVEVTD